MTAMPQISEVLDSGLLDIESKHQQEWRLRETAWNGKQHDIVQVHSSCPLRTDTLPTGLILLVGCSSDASHGWYKIVRTDGKTLLTGVLRSNDWLESADAVTARGVFAIGIAEASRPIDFNNGMVASEFQKTLVSVYSSTNGRRLYATQSSQGAVNRQSFTLNAAGSLLAVLSGEDVSLYRISPAAKAADGRTR